MTHNATKFGSPTHSGLPNSPSSTTRSNGLGTVKKFRAFILVALVGAMATLSFTTSSASSWGGNLLSRAHNPAATPKPASPGRVSRATRTQPSVVTGNRILADVGGTVALNIARRGHTATNLSDGRILIIGGENSDGQVPDSEVYDLESRVFS